MLLKCWKRCQGVKAVFKPVCVYTLEDKDMFEFHFQVYVYFVSLTWLNLGFDLDLHPFAICVLMPQALVCYFNTVCLWRCAVSSTQSWQPLKRRRGALKLPWLTYRKPWCWIMGHNENVCRQLSISCSSEQPSTKCPPDMRIRLLCLCRRFQSQSRVQQLKTQQQIFDLNHLNWLKTYKERKRSS